MSKLNFCGSLITPSCDTVTIGTCAFARWHSGLTKKSLLTHRCKAATPPEPYSKPITPLSLEEYKQT